MAQVIVTLRIMPTSPDVNLASVEKKAEKEITLFEGKVAKKEIVPVAFGLNALVIHFIMQESKGSTEKLETSISEIKGVNSVDVTDVRRAVG